MLVRESREAVLERLGRRKGMREEARDGCGEESQGSTGAKDIKVFLLYIGVSSQCP